MMPRARLGFSLIELLVVIAIIAALAGMLMPMLDQVREQARSRLPAQRDDAPPRPGANELIVDGHAGLSTALPAEVGARTAFVRPIDVP